MLIDNNNSHRYYFITPNISCCQRLLYLIKKAINVGVSLISLRSDLLAPQEYLTLARKASSYATNFSAKILVKGSPDILQNNWCHGMHLKSKQLLQYSNLNKKVTTQLIAASCHNIAEITKATQLNIDFITLSPVLPTNTHPQQQPLGIALAKSLTASAKLPVYWLGGQKLADLQQCLAYGAYGIAGITTFVRAIDS
jgi:8-oxo-dGTP diphosphatase